MIVFLESSPASGKSSCCEYLQGDYAVFVEPVDMWTSHLEGVYGPAVADWVLPMQMLALTTRHEILLRARAVAERHGEVVVVERSPRSDSIFAQDLVGADMDAYRHVRARYDALLAGLDCRHIYLRAPPEVCMQRVAVRGRPQERGMTLERARDIHRRHDIEFAGDVTVDADRPKAEVFAEVREIIRGGMLPPSPPERGLL